MNPLSHLPCSTKAAASIVLLATISFAGATFAVEAVTPAPDSAAPTAAGPVSKATVARDEARIKDLHNRLKITPAQESLWSAVANTMRDNDTKIDALAKARHDNAPTMTAVDDLRSYGEIAEAHASGIKAFIPVFASLYDSMDAAQKANADNVFRHAGHKSAKKAP
jgi:hypothetical protein